MTNSANQWQQICDEYLKKIHHVLAGASANEKQQIIDDIKVHLEERFNELSEDEHTWENFQQIITQLGPVEDYAALLQVPSRILSTSSNKHYLKWVILLSIVIFVCSGTVLLFSLRSEPVAYVVHFSPEGDFAPSTPRELLAEFNSHHPKSVSTSYFRTEPKNGKLMGSIVTKTESEKDRLVGMLISQTKLSLQGVQPVNAEQLEAHKARKQLSLSQRPYVVQTIPESLAFNVNPSTTEITVIFDQPMMNFSWSWVGGGEHYPQTTGDPKYDTDRTTCTLPVKLKPGHWYWIGINSEKYVHFKTEKHIPAVPYVILFGTADENGNPTQIPTEYIEEAKRINSK